jgi:hypothetical protein
MASSSHQLNLSWHLHALWLPKLKWPLLSGDTFKVKLRANIKPEIINVNKLSPFELHQHKPPHVGHVLTHPKLWPSNGHRSGLWPAQACTNIQQQASVAASHAPIQQGKVFVTWEEGQLARPELTRPQWEQHLQIQSRIRRDEMG